MRGTRPLRHPLYPRLNYTKTNQLIISYDILIFEEWKTAFFFIYHGHEMDEVEEIFHVIVINSA